MEIKQPGTREEMEGTIASRQVPAGPLEFTFCFQKNHPIAECRPDTTLSFGLMLLSEPLPLPLLLRIPVSIFSAFSSCTDPRIPLGTCPHQSKYPSSKRETLLLQYIMTTPFLRSCIHLFLAISHPPNSPPMRQWAFRAESWILSKMGSGEKFF